MKRKSEIKKLMIFALVCILCCIAGVFLGRISGRNEKNINDILEIITTYMQGVLPVIFAVVLAVMVSVSFLLYSKIRKIEKSLDGSESDDEKLDKIEEHIIMPILLSNLTQIISIFLFTACMDTAFFSEYGDKNNIFYFIFPTILLFLSFVFVIVIQRNSVELEKRINTEKTVSIFDFKFNSKWLNQCDEGEKMKAYKAGYNGFKAMNIACPILWLVSIFSALIFKTGVFPVFIVCVIWGIGITSYTVGLSKKEKV